MGGWPPADEDVVIAPEWEKIAQAAPRGLVMVIGGADTGKSTFARWLVRRLAAGSSGPLAFLDGDPGQSVLGPPTTVTLTILRGGTAPYRAGGRRWRRFVGSTTPRNHMLPLLVGVARLLEVARNRKIRTIIHDTTGLVDLHQGGVALKLAKIELLRPELVVAIRQGEELEPLLAPLRRSTRTRIAELRSLPVLRSRNMLARQRYRALQLARHFTGARLLELDLERYAVLPGSLPLRNQLLAFEDAAGFTLALGIATRTGESAKTGILTPVKDLGDVDGIRMADLTVNPASFRDKLLSESSLRPSRPLR